LGTQGNLILARISFRKYQWLV